MTDGTLKPGWRRVKFGEVVRLSKDRSASPMADGIERYVGLEHIEPGDLKVRSWGAVADGTTFTTRFSPGQVLFGKRRAYQRKVAVADFEGVCSGDIYVFESANPRTLLPELLPFLCQTDAFFDHAIGTSAGSLSPRTNWMSLAEYEFALPPLGEQRRSVQLLTAARNALETTLDACSSAEAVVSALCQHVATLSETKVPYVRVGEIAKFTSGKSITVSSLPREPSSESSIPVYGGNGLAGYTQRPLTGVDGPTIVIGRVGQFCGVTRMTKGPAWISDNALYPVWLAPKVYPSFLAICLRGTNLNHGKLGEYLPLITQTVVHNIRTPLTRLTEQSLWIDAFNDAESTANLLRLRANESHKLFRTQLAATVEAL